VVDLLRRHSRRRRQRLSRFADQLSFQRILPGPASRSSELSRIGRLLGSELPSRAPHAESGLSATRTHHALLWREIRSMISLASSVLSAASAFREPNDRMIDACWSNGTAP
jgi:hypothetical protein